MGRLILLPGLGADERMFENLGRSVLPMDTPRHLIPHPGEELQEYARRTGDHLEIGPGDLVGGASFGSVVAAAIARQRPVRGLVLIGGALDGSGLRPIPGERFLRHLPPRLLLPMMRSDRVLQHAFAPEGPELRRIARVMLDEVPHELLLYGSRMLVEYRSAAPLLAPIFAIHGDRDPVMAPPPVTDCRIISDAGHGIAWTHGAEVTDFLEQVWRQSNPEAAGEQRPA